MEYRASIGAVVPALSFFGVDVFPGRFYLFTWQAQYSVPPEMDMLIWCMVGCFLACANSLDCFVVAAESVLFSFHFCLVGCRQRACCRFEICFKSFVHESPWWNKPLHRQ